MKARTLIETAFRDIPDVYSGFSLARDIIYREALAGEKQHRNGRQSPRDFPATLAAKYFTVKWLAGYASGRDAMPTIANVHRMRRDCVLSASFVADYPEFAEWAKTVPAEFWALDYVELMGG